MAATEESLALLRSMDASLKQIVKLLTKTAPPEIADDRDLDSQYGDPVVKLNPRDWTGEPCKGRRMSECPAAFLDQLAETFDYFARKAEDTNEMYNGKPVAPYKRKDAARARGWSKRVRDGKGRQPAMAGAGSPDFGGDSDAWPDSDL
jgi:hypothetical protein